MQIYDNIITHILDYEISLCFGLCPRIRLDLSLQEAYIVYGLSTANRPAEIHQ